jgi:leader peptidase (prepilin peptidase)/N-methyltransferase
MNLIWAAAGAVIGLPAGTVLRGEVARLSVRSGEPAETSCRECATVLLERPALRCEHCGCWIGAAMAIELTSAAVLALLLARIGFQPAAAAFAYLGVLAVALTQIDAAVQRLPDRLTLPAYPALIVLLGLAAVSGDTWETLVRALLGGLALGTAYVLLGLLSSGQLGGGDIKLAGLIGLVLGWLGWRTLIAGASLGFVIAAAASLALLAGRRISRHSMISFGPYMLSGALLAVLASRW